MWDRGILKANAKLALRGRYWTAFAASLIALILSGGYLTVTWRYNHGYQQSLIDPNVDLNAILAQSGLMNLLSLMGLAYTVFVVFPIAIGISRFFVHNHFGVTQIETTFSGFKRNYLNGAGALLVTNLFIVLWSLLFIIPGIVKILQYSMVSYILADNPSVPGSRAREISRTMTNGEKGSILVLYLSFIGWYFLGALCFGIGTLFVNPYFQATQAELYVFLRDRAIQTNQVSPAEFGLIAPAPSMPPVNPSVL
jgi:uncharacterized membrane protein